MNINANPPYTGLNAELLDSLQHDYGFTIDRFGHAIKKIKGVKNRLKFMERCVRVEVAHGDKWLRTRKSIFYSEIEADKNTIFNMVFVKCDSDKG